MIADELALVLANVKDPFCQDCILHKDVSQVCIMGRGNVKSKIMLIGEGPGKDEDYQGKPFVGRCGKWLDKCLIALHINDKVYITNVVKCRPPDNRKPTPAEMIACRQYISAEIRLIEPKVIVAMGKTAAEALDFPIEIGRKFYKSSRLGNYYGIKTWHPAYCLRAGKPRTTEFFEHLKWARKFTHG